jgi:hypothetical protein
VLAHAGCVHLSRMLEADFLEQVILVRAQKFREVGGDSCRLALLPRRSCTLSYHSVERVGERSARTAVQAADVCPIPCFTKVAFDESHVPKVIQLVPDGDRLSGKTAVQCFSIRQTL